MQKSQLLYSKEINEIELITILFEHGCIKVNYKYNMLEILTNMKWKV